MSDYYLHIKSLHLIFLVSWFAGLFYIVRLFIYHTEANQQPDNEKVILQNQFIKMERLLWNVITTPAMFLTVTAGLLMLHIASDFLYQGWMQLKLAFVAGLLCYHFYCQKLLKELREGIFRFTSFQLRLWNEVATIFLVSIVFLVVLKNAVDWIWGLVGIFTFAIGIMLAVRLARKLRKKQ